MSHGTPSVVVVKLPNTTVVVGAECLGESLEDRGVASLAHFSDDESSQLLTCSPGSKRPSRDGSDVCRGSGGSAQCLSSEERRSPASATDPHGFMESSEKPLKVEKKESSEEKEEQHSDDDDAGEEPMLLRPTRPSALTGAPRVAPSPPAMAVRPAFPFPRALAAAPTTRGAVTRLHSIAQLAELVEGDGAAPAAAGGAGVKRTVAGAAVSAVGLGAGGATGRPRPAARLPASYQPTPLLKELHGSAAAAPLRLRKGETVIIILHRGRESLAELVNCYTEYLSKVRIFVLDLSALPPQEYEEEDEEARTAATDSCDGEEGGDPSNSRLSQPEQPEEDATLFVAGRAAPDTQQQLRRRNSLGGGPHDPFSTRLPSLSSLGVNLASVTSELSDQLNEVAEIVMGKVSRLLRVETVLNPGFFHREQKGPESTDGGAKEAAEPLLLPAMVVWRAAGGESEDYSPYLPCSYSDGSTPSLSQQQQQFSAFSQSFTAQLSTHSHAQQAQGMHSQQQQQQQQQQGSLMLARKRRYRHFGDYVRANGGALVVKQLNKIDYVHSFSLYSPVFTVAHLYKHVIDTAKEAILSKFSKTGELMFPSSFAPLPPLPSCSASPTVTPGGATSAERAQEFFRLLDRKNVKSRTLIYLGASWCPPCMRIVADMPLFIKDNFVLADGTMQRLDFACAGDAAAGPAAFSNPTRQNDGKGLHVFVKADMDLAKPIFDLFKVEVIPVFLILDNTKLFELERLLLKEKEMAAAKGVPFVVQDSERAMAEAIAQAEVGRLQNSQRDIINVFVEKHCTSLSFDEDF